MAWPDTPLVIETTLALGADLTADPTTWSFSTDITPYTYDRDGSASIVITRGRQNEVNRAQPSAIDLTLDNRDGRFVTRNPTGAYYPSLRRNTPLRVRVNPGTGLATRGVAYVSEWPPRWDTSETDHYVPVRAEGVLRRLGQGGSPLSSVLYRTISAAGPRAYWPLEDGSGATAAASGLAGRRPLALNGSVDFASNSDVPGSAPLPTFTNGGRLVGAAAGTSSTAWSVEFTAVLVDGFYVAVGWESRGTVTAWHFTVLGPTDIRLLGYDTAGVQQQVLITPVDFTAAHIWAVTAEQSGADIALTVYEDGASVATGTWTSQTLGNITTIGANPFGNTYSHSVGHLAVYDDATQTGHYTAFTGNAGELSGTRFLRLCGENDVACDQNGSSTERMGPQTVKTLADLLRECEAAEEGLFVERLTGKLGFDPHAARENLAVGLTLNYATGKVSPPLEPTDDDQLVRNDVTVTRSGGSWARVVDDDGPLGVVAVGRYDDSITLNLYDDDQPYFHAGWRVNLGTADGLRFPRVTVNLRRNTDLIAAWLALDVGSRIKITNLPDNISYDDVDLIVEGYTEQISQTNWIITFNCAPYRPYGVFELASTSGDTDEFLGRLAPESMALLIARDTTQTAWTVATDPKFTVDSDDYPMDLIADGERITATAASVASPSFVAVGAAAHADNASVTPGMPAGVQEGDLLLVLAAIRSSGTGTVDAITGYSSLDNNGNMRLQARIHDGSEVAPTVAFTGGVAGDTCSAQMCAFRNVTRTVLVHPEQTNASAQDIATRALARYDLIDALGNLVANCVVLLVAWKQDDWTSSAPPAGFTEIGEPTSILGNDQGITWAYQIQTTATAVDASSFVITGGAAAISRSTILALRTDVVSLTVTRSVNGVVKSHTQNADLDLADPHVLGL